MRFATISLVALAIVTTGCQQTARLDWTAPAPAANLSPVYCAPLASDRRESVAGNKLEGEALGRHTFSLFAIPVGNINADVNTPVQPTFDRAIRDALRAAGYDPRPASEAPAGTPILSGEIRQCYLWSYMWFWPVIIQGGEVKVALCVKQPGGEIVGEGEFKRNAPGMGFGASFGFDIMAKNALTKLVADIAKRCSTDEFGMAVVRK